MYIGMYIYVYTYMCTVVSNGHDWLAMVSDGHNSSIFSTDQMSRLLQRCDPREARVWLKLLDVAFAGHVEPGCQMPGGAGP